MSVLDDLVQKYGLDKLNSATQYPSIITYHNLGDRGGLTNSLRFTDDEPLPNDNLEVSATEKIDGTNSRIVVLGDDFFIGSRNDFVHAKGDRVVTNDAVTPVYMGLTNFLSSYTPSEDRLLVLFGEAYGRKINGAKCYTENAKPGFRLFDGFTISIDELTKLFEENDSLRSPRYIYNLLEHVGPKRCVFCDCGIPELVQGAHIWPVASIKKVGAMPFEEKLKCAIDGHNGLWLCENHHKLFDENIIMIGDDGRIKYKDSLPSEHLDYISQITTIDIIPEYLMTERFTEYLWKRNHAIAI